VRGRISRVVLASAETVAAEEEEGVVVVLSIARELEAGREGVHRAWQTLSLLFVLACPPLLYASTAVGAVATQRGKGREHMSVSLFFLGMHTRYSHSSSRKANESTRVCRTIHEFYVVR